MASKSPFLNKRIFITGGSGFVGSHLARACVKRGARVCLLVVPSDSCWRIKDIKDKLIIEESYITNERALKKIVQSFRPHYVFHLAAVLNHEKSLTVSEDLYEVNVKGTQFLLQALEGSRGLQRFVYAGTIEEYGANKVPFREDQRELPTSLYSLTKLFASQMVEYMARERDLPTVIVRFSLVYGPGQDLGKFFIPTIITSCITEKSFSMTRGDQTRDFIFVQDLVNGILAAAASSKAVGQVINLGSGKEVQIKKVAAMINAIMGNLIEIKFGAIPYRVGESMHFWMATTKARKILDWKSQVGLQQGLKETVKWYRENLNKVSKKNDS